MQGQQPCEEGSILENTPKHGSMAELIELAEDRGIFESGDWKY